MVDTTQSQPHGRLLVVDDEPQMVQFLVTALEQQGYAVTGFTASPDALEALRAGNFDVLLADLRMPELDGLALLRAGLEIDPDLVGLIMTGRAGVPTAVQALQLGAFDYLRKPFEVKAVLPTLQRALELRRVRLENLQLRESAALHEFSQVISATLDAATVAQKMAAAAQQQLGADEATVLSLAPGDDALVIAGVAGSRPRAGLVGQRVPLTQSIAGWIARAGMAGEALVLNGAVNDPRFTALFPRPEINSAIAMPMLAGGRVTGVLTVNALAPRRPFRPGQVHALSILANAGAAALENAALVGQLRASELRFRELFEYASDGILLLDERGLCLAANARLSEWLGYAPGGLAGRSTREILVPDDLPDMRRDFAAMQAGRLIRGERRLQRQDGTELPVELTARRAPDGTFQAIIRDITERQQAEQARRDSEARFSALFHASPAAITLTTLAEGRILDVNTRFERSLGYTRAEAIGRTVAELGSWAEPAGRQAIIDQLAQQGAVHNVEVCFKRKSGERFDGLLSMERIDLAGQPCVVSLVLDITDRKQAEQALRASEKRFATLFNASPVPTTLSTVDGRIVDVNQAFERAMGFTRAEVIGQRARDIGAWANPEERARLMRLLAEHGALSGVEVAYRRKSGEVMPALTSFDTVELGGERYVLTLALDITERQKAEQALRDNELRLRVALKGVDIAVFNLDRDLRYTWMYNAQLGYAAEQVIGHTDAELLPGEDSAKVIEIKRRALETGLAAREEVAIHMPAGTLIYDLIVEPLLDRQGAIVGLTGATLDITERKRTEDQMRFQAGLLAAVGQAVIATDPQGRILYWNHSAERLYGWTAEEALGQSTSMLTPSTFDRAEAIAILNRVRAGETWSGEYTVQRRDGTTFPALVTDTPFYDQTGALAGIIGMSTDNSERKQHQRELETISQISAALRTALTADQIPAVILNQLEALFGVDAADLSLLDLANGELWVARAIGRWARWSLVRTPVDKGIAGRVVTTGEPYVTNAAHSDPLIYPPEAATGIGAVVVLPLIAHGDAIGTLAAGRQTPFAEGDLRLLGSIADITANALQRATLHEQTRLRAEQLAALNALARALAETLQLEQIYERLEAATRQLLPAVATVVVSLFDPERQALTDVYRAQAGRRLETDEPPRAPDSRVLGAQAEVVQSRRPVTLSPAAGPASVLAPLLVKGQVIGVLQAHGPAAAGFGPEAADLLATVASTAAVAIENARLFAETQRRLLRLQALRTIDLAITSSLDSRISLRVLVDQAATQLGVDAVDVLLLDASSYRLELAVGRGFKSPPPRFAMRVDDSLAGRAVLERRLVRVPRLASQPSHPARETWMLVEGFVAYWAMPLVAKGLVRGVLEVFQRQPLAPDDEWLDFLETLAEQAAIAVDNSGLFADLQRSNTDLELAYNTTLEGWSQALDLRDKETEGHTQRVTERTERLAHAMGLSESELVHIRRGALLHDIGKMGIPDSILLKPGPLSPDEWVIMRQHPRYAFELLTPIAYLRPALDIPYCHHEKWDGSGYPRGLRGEQIPLAARVFAVVDVWDALRSDRPYRPGWPEAKIIDYLRANSGTHFDPRVVPAFLRLLDQI